MTGVQCISMYEILRKYGKNRTDAKAVVSELEQVIDNKPEARKDVLATKEDIARLEIKLEIRFNALIMWMFGTGIGIVALIFTVIKLFVEK